MVNNLLIIEDNPAMRRMIKSVVEDLAESVHEREDGSDALPAYEEFLPEWVLMDVQMKEMSGLTATKEITDAHPEAKIVIVTKNNTPRMREAAREAGASAFVSKENLFALRELITDENRLSWFKK